MSTMGLAKVVPLPLPLETLQSGAGAHHELAVEHVARRFGRLVAVNDLSLSVRRGETFGLLGPNGAGKSTLMKMMVGADAPDAGSINLGGRGVTELDTRRRIGIAPQEIALHGRLTAAENLAFAGRLYGMTGKRLRARVDFALEVAGLGARRNDRVQGFSGGMQRRLNLACAIVHEPSLVLLDEPTAGVDPQSRNHIFEALERLKSEGVTIVYSTHYMEEAERLCDRIAIIDHGRLLALGSLRELTSAHGAGFAINVEFEGAFPANLPRPTTRTGSRAQYRTADPWPLVNEIARTGASIASLNIERPSLEGVFLALTGRSLRD